MTQRHEQRYLNAIAQAEQRVKDNTFLAPKLDALGAKLALPRSEAELRTKLGLRKDDQRVDALVASAWTKLQTRT